MGKMHGQLRQLYPAERGLLQTFCCTYTTKTSAGATSLGLWLPVGTAILSATMKVTSADTDAGVNNPTVALEVGSTVLIGAIAADSATTGIMDAADIPDFFAAGGQLEIQQANASDGDGTVEVAIAYTVDQGTTA
jgi:hypothetical protein